MVLSERLTFHEVTPDVNGEPFVSNQVEVDRSILPLDGLSLQPTGEIKNFKPEIPRLAPTRSKEDQKWVKLMKRIHRGVVFQK